MTKIINLFAGPGAGKSTTAAGLFFEMKLMNLKCELITEYAKELTYAGDFVNLSSPIHMLDAQYRRQKNALGQVEYIITDSPILLPMIYSKEKEYISEFRKIAVSHWNEFKNVNFFINRTKEYQAYGRNESEYEAIKKDEEIIEMLGDLNIPFEEIPGDRNAPNAIIRSILLEKLFPTR